MENLNIIKTGNKDLDRYLLKVVLYPNKIDNEEINSLKRYGYTEDEIFKLTVNVAATARNLNGVASDFLNGQLK